MDGVDRIQIQLSRLLKVKTITDWLFVLFFCSILLLIF